MDSAIAAINNTDNTVTNHNTTVGCTDKINLVVIRTSYDRIIKVHATYKNSEFETHCYNKKECQLPEQFLRDEAFDRIVIKLAAKGKLIMTYNDTNDTIVVFYPFLDFEYWIELVLTNKNKTTTQKVVIDKKRKKYKELCEDVVKKVKK